MIAGCVSGPLLSLMGWEWDEYRTALAGLGTDTAPSTNNTMALVAQMVGQESCHSPSMGGGVNRKHRLASSAAGGQGLGRNRGLGGAGRNPGGGGEGRAGDGRRHRRHRESGSGRAGSSTEAAGEDEIKGQQRRQVLEASDDDDMTEAGGEAVGGQEGKLGGRRGEGSQPFVWEADAQELLTHILRRYEHEQVVYLRRPVVVKWGDHLQEGSPLKQAKER